MSKKVIAYKCFYVEKPTGKIWSTNKWLNHSGLWQEYSLTELNLPKFKFPILAYDNLEDAKDFSHGRFSIAEVTGEISERKVFRILEVGDPGIDGYWEAHPKYSVADIARKFNYQPAPDGTIGLKNLWIIKFL